MTASALPAVLPDYVSTLERGLIMNREALFCDGTQDYVIPAEPKANEKVILRFRTAHNDVEEVHLLELFYVAHKISRRI